MPGDEALAFHDLTTAPDDRVRLRRFHDQLYGPAFPDPDEKESLAAIERYLELKAAGWYGPNNYHVVLALSGERIVGGAIADYLADPNAGVVEFLVVAPDRRGAGLGRRLLAETETLIARDARRTGRPDPDRIVAEIEDPFLVDLSPGGFDPFARARIWGRWGFRKLQFPYVQPALSESQRPVHHLMLATKPFAADERDAVPSARVENTLRAYLRWAMRIPDPESSAEYRGMRDDLARRGRVPAVALERHVGHDPAAPLAVEEIGGEGPALDAALRVYARAFPPGPTALPPAAFRRNALARLGASAPPRYHLWALREAPGRPVAGIASFFSLAGIGFGGYLALLDDLRGRGRARLVLARMEARMRLDRTGARGWLVECVPGSEALAVCARLGFSEIALDYRQRALGGGQPSPPLRLAYKDFGTPYGAPSLTRPELRAAPRSIHRFVYGIDTPERHPGLAAAEAQMAAWPGDDVEWSAPGR